MKRLKRIETTQKLLVCPNCVGDEWKIRRFTIAIANAFMK